MVYALGSHGTEHPGGLFVNAHAVRDQRGGGFVIACLRLAQNLAAGFDHLLVRFCQYAHHLLGGWHFLDFFDGAECGEFLVGAWRKNAECAYPFGNLIDRGREFRVVLLKLQVQLAKLRARHVPMKIVRL